MTVMNFVGSMLDSKGRCCGRKPLEYRGSWHGPRQYFCTRCDRSFDLDTGKQIENWAWKRDPDSGEFRKVRT